MVEVGTDVVTYVDNEGRERPALVKGKHEKEGFRHPWLTLAVVSLNPHVTDEVKGVKSRQTYAVPMVPHQRHAGPAAHWIER